MSFTNAAVLKGFVGANNFLVADPAPDGLSEAMAQADDVIYQTTGIAVPADPMTVPAKLRNIGARLVLWFTVGMGQDLTDAEYKKRERDYDDALAELAAIANGEDDILKADGTSLITKTTPSAMSSTALRMTEPL